MVVSLEMICSKRQKSRASQSLRGPTSRVLLELSGIHPFLVNQAPPIRGQRSCHVLVREPCVTVESPACSPGVAYQQRTGLAADVDAVVIPHSDVGVSAVVVTLL